MVPPHGKTNLVKAFIINYLKQLIFQKAVLKAVHRQTKTLYEYSTLWSESGKRTYSITAKRMISRLFKVPEWGGGLSFGEDIKPPSPSQARFV